MIFYLLYQKGAEEDDRRADGHHEGGQEGDQGQD